MNKFEEGKSYSFPEGYLTVQRILDPEGTGPARVQAFLHLNHAPGTLILTSPILVDPARGEYVNTPAGRCYAAEHKWPDLPAGAGMLLNKFDPKDPVMTSMASQIKEQTTDPQTLKIPKPAAEPKPYQASGYKVSHLLAEYGLMGMMSFKIPVKHAEFIRALLDKADEVI